MADPGLNQSGADRAREQMQDAAERARLTFRRLSGLDRSGPPPPETLAGQPWRPWTIPNAIGFIRLALIPVFLVLALTSDDGTDIAPLVIFAVIGWSDYLDGIAARVTGQYSRLGALLDPLVDRLLVISGVIVCWKFDLLPRWALGRPGGPRGVHDVLRPLGAESRPQRQGQLARARRRVAGHDRAVPGHGGGRLGRRRRASTSASCWSWERPSCTSGRRSA